MTSLAPEKRSGAIRLRSEGGYAVVEIEQKGHWIELIREHFSGPVCHIIEPSGIRERLTPSYESQAPTFASDGLMP